MGSHPILGFTRGVNYDSRSISSIIARHIEFTKDQIKGTTRSILLVERAATALLAHALSGLGDPFALHAFCSDGGMKFGTCVSRILGRHTELMRVHD